MEKKNTTTKGSMQHSEPVLIRLPIRPMSINSAWQGRRFKTPKYKRYCQAVSCLLPKRETITGYINLEVALYLKYFATSDVDNFLKPMIDILVSNRIIEDDKFILKITVEKFKATEDSICLTIIKR